jgi:hypothetical protein
LPCSDRGSFGVAKCWLIVVGGIGAIESSSTDVQRRIALVLRHPDGDR